MQEEDREEDVITDNTSVTRDKRATRTRKKRTVLHRPKTEAAKVAAEEYRPTRTSSADDRRDVMETEGLPPGFVGRWVNDVGGRIEKRLKQGYGFVNDQYVYVGDSTVVHGRRPKGATRLVCGYNERGEPLHTYFMMQRADWNEEDSKILAKKADETVADLRKDEEKSGRYGDGLKISHS